MTARYTPGPWCVVHGFVASVVCREDPDDLICKIHGENRIADAQAIAAAPDLVEACRVALVTFQRYAERHDAKGDNCKAQANWALARTMRQALQKAGVEP